MSVYAVVVLFFNAAMALVALAAPARILAFFGVEVTTADGRNEVRSVYGGTGIAVIAALVVSAGEGSVRKGVYAMLVLYFGVMGLLRAVAALFGGTSARPWLFVALELGLAGLMILAFNARS
jgi:hypothetical protein